MPDLRRGLLIVWQNVEKMRGGVDGGMFPEGSERAQAVCFLTPCIYEMEMSQSEELKLSMEVLGKLFNKHLSLILLYFNSRKASR